MNKPNRRLYVSLSTIFITITFAALLIDNKSAWFTVLTGIGCGGIASVIVAWLVDLANCKLQSNKQKKLAEFALNNFHVSVCYYLETIADLCVDNDPKMERQKHSFEEWVQIYVSKLKNGITVRRPWLLDAIERIENSYSTIENNIYWLVDGNIITVDEYKKIKVLYRVIHGSKIYYMIRDKEPNPDIIMETNMQIVAQMKLIDSFSNLLAVSYSGNGDLSDKENAVNEMEYFQ